MLVQKQLVKYTFIFLVYLNIISSFEKINFFLFYYPVLRLVNSRSSNPKITKFTLAVASSEGGNDDISGGTFNENSNVTVTAASETSWLFYKREGLTIIT